MKRTLFLILLLSACGKTPHLSSPSPLHWDSFSMPGFSHDGAGRFYRYAPSIVETEPGVRHIYTCGNTVSELIRDHVVHRVALRDNSGHWTLGPEDVVFGPSDEGAAVGTPAATGCGSFDCYHTCDPEYVSGQFRYNGTAYTIALFYTGNDFDGSTHNAVGLALANDPDGPFTRVKAPIVPYSAACDDGPPWSSGAMQPAATSVDGAGQLYLFTRNECRGVSLPVRYAADLSDFADDRPPALSAPLVLTRNGLTGLDHSPDDSLNNGAWLYDAVRDRFYVVRSQHPMPPAGDEPTILPRAVQLDSMVADGIRHGGGTWQPLGNVAPSDDSEDSWVSGFDRNHNAGLVRDPLGHPVEPDAIELSYTTCNRGTDWLFDRTVYTVRGALPHSWR
jgi:hypothetical protein